MKAPVIFLVFNRPELTRRVLSTIREAKPEKLFVVCDGPRRDQPDDFEKVAVVRNVIADGVDWPCDLQCEYSDTNLGCRERVVSGLNWVFSQVEEAIILEDDCLPDPSFFPFCEEVLARYRVEPKVMHIGGNNFLGNRRSFSASYTFSRYGHIWGWATWRRAWQLYETDLASWKNPIERSKLMAGLGLGDERGFWGSIFDRCADQPLAQTTWDYQWIYACWKNRGLAIYPASHLVENIGQGNEATHTFDVNPLFARRSAPLSFPLRHPAVVEDDTGLNREVFRAVFMGKRPWREKVWHGLRRRFAGVQ